MKACLESIYIPNDYFGMALHGWGRGFSQERFPDELRLFPTTIVSKQPEEVGQA